MKQSINDIFVIFRPRDIVSGDFYWFSEVEVENGEPLKVIAAVDCTGHGVPGAIMSMIGNDLLSESVRLQGMSDPAQILNYLNSHLKDRLQQDSDTTVRDGMDIALCVIDPNQQELRFAGAKNPLFYVRDGDVQEIRGDKFPIGGYKNKVHSGFNTHIVPLTDTPTAFYICSDGYQDQFGGEKKLKFMKKNLKELFGSIYQQEAKRQKGILDKTLDLWMDETKQIDDILLIGFKA